MAKKEIQLLIALVGIAVAFLSWQYIYKPKMEQVEQMNAQNQTLQSEVNRLEQMEANRANYVADTEELKAEAEDVIALFPAGYLVEDQIMYLYGMEGVSENEVVVPSVGMANPESIPYAGNLAVEGYNLTDEGIAMNKSATNITFMTTYDGLKNVVKYVYDMPGRKAITSVSVSGGEDGYLSGTMTMDFYALEGAGKEYDPVSIGGVSLGKDNIFGSLNSVLAE